MIDWQVVVLAIVQGLTEFLPVSSSAHLVIAERFMPDFHQADLVLEVWLHVGTLVATIAAFWTDIVAILRGLWQRQRAAVTETWLIVLGTIPTGVIGVAFKDELEASFDAPFWVGIQLVITSVTLLLAWYLDRGKRTFAPNNWWRSLVIGTAQGIAILPGISRSGSTIVAGMLSGMERVAAARYSFLLAIPAVAAATLVKTKDYLENPTASLPFSQLAIGAVISGVVGFIVLRWFMELLRRGSLLGFAIYCAVVGVAFAVWVM